MRGLFDIYGVRSREAEEFFELLRKDNEVKLEEIRNNKSVTRDK